MIKTKKLQVLIDGQKDFIDGVLRNEEAIKRLPNLKARIRNHDGVTIATHDTHFNKIQVESNWPPAEGIVYENSYEHKFAGLPAHCIKLTEGWEIHPELLEVLNEKNANGQKKFFAIDKYTFGTPSTNRHILLLPPSPHHASSQHSEPPRAHQQNSDSR